MTSFDLGASPNPLSLPGPALPLHQSTLLLHMSRAAHQPCLATSLHVGRSVEKTAGSESRIKSFLWSCQDNYTVFQCLLENMDSTVTIKN